MVSDDIRLNPTDLHAFLEKYFSYYTTLNGHNKNLFVERLLIFIRSKHFVSQKNLEVNNKVKAIVSASAVQLTLGLKDWQLGYFDTIILFPADFKNEISGLYLKGETNLTGFVSFSWKSFIEGYRIPNDNINLGLHEFAHALRFNGIRGENNDYFFENYFWKWYCYAYKEFYKLQKGLPSIFRSYGGANINEFLSVAIEHFFESPQQFKNNAPELYSATAILLNQKTDGTTTEINVREKEFDYLKKKESISAFNPDMSFFTSPGVQSSYIFILIGALTILQTGLFSFPSLVVLALYAGLMLKNDFKYARFMVDENGIKIYKGFLAFRNRSIRQISLYQLVNIELDDGGNDQTVIFNYFDSLQNFCSDTTSVKMDDEVKLRFINELRKNFVWVIAPKLNPINTLSS